MAQAKRIYILVTKVNKLFSFFLSWCLLKEKENMFSMFLSSYRNAHESLGELEKAVETLPWGSCSHSISRSPKLPLVSLKLDRNTVNVFYFLNKSYWPRVCLMCMLKYKAIPFASKMNVNDCLHLQVIYYSATWLNIPHSQKAVCLAIRTEYPHTHTHICLGDTITPIKDWGFYMNIWIKYYPSF